MSESEYIEDVSGESGVLAKFVGLFNKANASLTAAMDAFANSEETDSFDASCNTCMHFARKPMTPLEKSERNIFGMPGTCLLKSVEVRGWQRGQDCSFDNAACYENRRTGMRWRDGVQVRRVRQ